jgi:hypothetical protein
VRIPAGPALGLILFLAGSTVSAWGEEAVVGSVKTAHGGAVIRRGPDSIAAHEGAHIFLNDTLRTAADGDLALILQDGTRISLGPNTELKVDRFVYQPAEGKFGLLLQLARGVLAYVSGKIAQFSPGSVSVETPVGVLGLRGTQFAVSIEGS